LFLPVFLLFRLHEFVAAGLYLIVSATSAWAQQEQPRARSDIRLFLSSGSNTSTAARSVSLSHALTLRLGPKSLSPWHKSKLITLFGCGKEIAPFDANRIRPERRAIDRSGGIKSASVKTAPTKTGHSKT